MASYMLDAATVILCPHGGQVKVAPSVTRARLGGRPPLLSRDRATVVGCGFNVSGSPSPCLTVQWSLAATRVEVDGGAPLLSSSIGICKNAAGAPQGPVKISGYQTRVRAS